MIPIVDKIKRDKDKFRIPMDLTEFNRITIRTRLVFLTNT